MVFGNCHTGSIVPANLYYLVGGASIRQRKDGDSLDADWSRDNTVAVNANLEDQY